jgi:hypothetical protein
MAHDWMDQGIRMREGYDVMQVCLNGHMITSCAESLPQFRSDHCPECGARTIAICEHCKTSIRGFYHSPGVISLSDPPVPRYCFKCGVAFPWQSAAAQSLQNILKEGGLSDAEMKEASDALPDVLRDTPNTQLASLRLKRFLGKLAPQLRDIAIKVITDIASETAKKALGL